MDEIFVLKDGDPNAVSPAHGDYFVFESHGCTVFGRIILPAFYDADSLCPAVFMLHGHPGGDKNWDIAETLRANGYAVVIFSYRGVWGSHGDYSMTHIIEDVLSAVEHLRKNAAAYRVDPEKIFLFGHSMGGFAALNAIACGAPVKGAVLLAPYDAGFMYHNCRERFESVMDCRKKGYFQLTSDDALHLDAEANAKDWDFRNLLPKFDKNFPFCFIDGKQDRTSLHMGPLAQEMQQAGFCVDYHLLDDGHMFPVSRASVARIALAYFNKIK